MFLESWDLVTLLDGTGVPFFIWRAMQLACVMVRWHWNLFACHLLLFSFNTYLPHRFSAFCGSNFRTNSQSGFRRKEHVFSGFSAFAFIRGEVKTGWFDSTKLIWIGENLVFWSIVSVMMRQWGIRPVMMQVGLQIGLNAMSNLIHTVASYGTYGLAHFHQSSNLNQSPGVNVHIHKTTSANTWMVYTWVMQERSQVPLTQVFQCHDIKNMVDYGGRSSNLTVADTHGFFWTWFARCWFQNFKLFYTHCEDAFSPLVLTTVQMFFAYFSPGDFQDCALMASVLARLLEQYLHLETISCVLAPESKVGGWNRSSTTIQTVCDGLRNP